MNKYSLKAFVVFFFINSILQAQPDFKLVDSLINKRMFPIISFLPGCGASQVSIDTSKFHEVYSFDLHEISGQKKITYFLESNDSNRVFTNSSRSQSLENCGTNTMIQVVIPKVHLVFFNAYSIRRKSDNFRYISFFIDHFVKNKFDSTWTTKDFTVNLKIFDSHNQLVRDVLFDQKNLPTKKEAEGWISTGVNEMDYKSQIQIWSHANPYVHHYAISVFDKNNRPYEVFQEKIGFRDIRKEGKQILINNEKIAFNSIELDPPQIGKDTLSEYLRKIKVNNFNSITLTSRGGDRFFDLCDSIGLYVFQEFSNNSFSSLSDFLNYFVNVKEHPSLVTWNSIGHDNGIEGILRRLDRSRPVLVDRSYINAVVKDWNKLDSSKRTELKNRFQIFKFYFIPDHSILKIDREEYFKCSDKIVLKWVVKKSGLRMTEGVLTNIEFRKNKAEVMIPQSMAQYKSTNFSFEFQLEILEDCYPYQRGDIIALSKFSYALKEGTLIYKVDY